MTIKELFEILDDLQSDPDKEEQDVVVFFSRTGLVDDVIQGGITQVEYSYTEGVLKVMVI